MSFRRMTRSLCKTMDQQLETAKTNSMKRKRAKKPVPPVHSPDVDLELSCERLEAALNPAADFLPVCFQSQPRPPSSQPADPDLSFPCDLLQACDAALTDFSWKYECDDSPPATQLDMVNGMDQILQSSSLLYSPVPSVAPVPSPPSPHMTSAEELLHFYLPSPDPMPSPLSDDDTTHIADEDLLEDLDSILGSYEEPETDGTLSNIHIGYNPPADTLALAMSSQYEEGLYVIEEASQSATDAPVAGPSGKAKGGKKVAAATGAKRGRKRKASSDADSSDEKKRRQNAEAAKNYRKRKAEQMNKVFEEKEEVAKELERVRKKMLAKLNERNILLKMLYESYKENGQSAPHKILFPPWIETWYQKQKDD